MLHSCFFHVWVVSGKQATSSYVLHNATLWDSLSCRQSPAPAQPHSLKYPERFDHFKRLSMMDRKERAALKAMPDVITIYRTRYLNPQRLLSVGRPATDNPGNPMCSS